tara:strand:- start:407 stop:865 length:459 start_codon:yes stop_codon:yes gene_type:complete
MEFKFNSSVFKVSAEQHKEQKGDKYDPGKNYPNFEGTLSIPKGQLYALVEYLQYASGTDLKHDSYIDDVVIPIKVAGWAKESASGKKYLSLQYAPQYKTLLAAQEAKEAQAIAAHAETLQQPSGACSVNAAAANLAQSTEGTVVKKAEEDIF